MTIYALTDELRFPDPRYAEKEGLLAVGGDLSVPRLLLAYSMGIFPWFSEGQPILWWSPDPRIILKTGCFHASRSLKKVIRQKRFTVTMDKEFRKVMDLCAEVHTRKDKGTWIGRRMMDAYCRLHDLGFAHSVEVWSCGQIAGGLYGVSLGAAFFGESMFSRQSDASKVALAALVDHLQRRGDEWIDCQVATDHLKRLGAEEISRSSFLGILKRALHRPTVRGTWTLPGAG